ncbi:uncharacterized protein LOC114729636 isoform X2 [Neltuma alba]|uniref:uncharacterized protein LOC114729636 isoform X2 n=1 Tax=Neltuma alba TaxID=207710 RepID=UPI0010A3CB31|nr:uncharacterized protein LOC114729636 isoform X2 [Prosopis alba]
MQVYITLVLMGDESCLRSISSHIMGCLKGAAPVEVVGLDMEEEREGVFHEAVDKACKILGNLDAFVNCYTYEGKTQEHLEVEEEEMKKIMRINYMAAWYLLKAVGQKMRDFNRGGSIVFMTSIIGAERGLHPGAAAFASAMAAVQQLVRASAMEIGKYQVRVNAVARGLHADDEYPKSVGRERTEKLVRMAAPMERWLDVKKDLTSTVIYLISRDSRYMTGTTIYVDGAQSLTRPRLRSFM